MGESIRIQLCKICLIFGAVLSAAFVAGGVWMLWTTTPSSRSPIWFVHGAGLANVVFFGHCAVFYFRKLFDERPGLVLNAAGLLDNSSAIAGGFVPWSDVVGFGTWGNFGQKVVVVNVVDPARYAEIGNPIVRAVKRMNIALCGSPITIVPNSLEISFSELVQLCDAEFGKYRALS